MRQYIARGDHLILLKETEEKIKTESNTDHDKFINDIFDFDDSSSEKSLQINSQFAVSDTENVLPKKITIMIQ